MKQSTISEFFDNFLIHYSSQSNFRHIPFLDGFKESQRKAIWGLLKRGENTNADTVERIAASVCSLTDYKHGTNSMEDTIVKLAQNFPGSNNIPLLEAHGQFGNQLSSEASAPRYIKTKLSSDFRKIFPKEDDNILTHKISNGLVVEPLYFTPLLPMVLINGADGVGTGHSTFIFSYNPKDIIKNIKQIIKGGTVKPRSTLPYWNGFKGSVERNPETNQIIITGCYELKPGKTSYIRITELPIGVQSEKFELLLRQLVEQKIIYDYDNNSGEENGFDFMVTVPKALLETPHEEIQKLFKLVSKETENLTVWNSEGKLQRFECIEDLLIDFVNWRLPFFEKRRLFQIDNLNKDIQLLNEKIRFIQYYIKNVNVFKNTRKKELVELLISEKFTEYDKLLSMPIWNLTKDKMEELKNEVLDLESKLSVLEKDTKEQMFSRELNQLKF